MSAFQSPEIEQANSANNQGDVSEEESERLHWRNVMRTMLLYEVFIGLEFEVK